MSKIPRLPKGSKIRKESSGSRQYFVLWLGKSWTGGPTRKRCFAKQQDAVAAWEEEKAKKAALGSSGYTLTSAEFAEATACFSLLRESGSGLSLSAAVKQALHGFRRKSDVVTFATATAAFLKSKQERQTAKRTQQGYASFLRLLAADLPKQIGVHEIGEESITRHIRRFKSGTSQNATLRHLKAFFRWTVQRGYRLDDPTEKIEKACDVREEITCLTIDEATNLMRVVAEDNKAKPMLAYIAICLFAGLRPAEADKLQYSHVRLNDDRPHILVTANRAKTRQRRTVRITPNLSAWLALCEPLEGSIRPSACRAIHEYIQEITGLKPWPTNILRHSFASYHYAQYREENATAAEMGNTPAVVFRDYRSLVSSAEAAKFWAIYPPKAVPS